MAVPPFATRADVKNPARGMRMNDQLYHRLLASDIQARWHALGHLNVIAFAEEAQKAYPGPSGRYIPATWCVKSNLVNGLPPSSAGRLPPSAGRLSPSVARRA